MANEIPQIFNAGEYDSRLFFKKNVGGDVSHERTVSHYEIDIFTADGGISHINGNSLPIKKGLLLFAKPNDKRKSTLHFNARYIHFTCENEEINGMLSFVPAFFAVNDYDGYMERAKKIAEAFHGLGKYDSLAASGLLIDFLHTLYNDSLGMYVDSGGETRSKGLLTSACDFIKIHYGEHLTVDDIAKYCNLSTSYFYKIFTRAIGTTPNEYLNTTRLAASKTMLSGTDRSLSDIAEACGFNSQSYFCYAFKKAFSVTPAEYRQSHGYFSL